jgi:hypothetical protein
MGRYLARYRRFLSPLHEYNGALGRVEQILLFGRDIAVFPGLVCIGYHYCERLGGAFLPLPQLLYYCIVRCITCQEKPSQTFDSQDLTSLKELPGGVYRIQLRYQITVVIGKLYLWTAYRASVGLGMEATVQGIIVFSLTS